MVSREQVKTDKVKVTEIEVNGKSEGFVGILLAHMMDVFAKVGQWCLSAPVVL